LDPGHFGPETFRTQVRSVPRLFGPGTEVPGHFGPIFLGPKCPGSEVSDYQSEYIDTAPMVASESEANGAAEC